MRTNDKLDSPYLNDEVGSPTWAEEPGVSLGYKIDRGPFANSVGFRGETAAVKPTFEAETYAGLNRALKSLSLLPHFVDLGATKTKLFPINPGIYDGKIKYKIADPLQQCLNVVMARKEFSHINVALVDLTKGASQPEFAGFNHKQRISIENIGKIGAMLAAFQLRADLRVALDKKRSSSLSDLFDKVRDDWARTQLDAPAPAKAFAGTMTLRRDLVLFKGATVGLTDPKSPHLERIFKDIPAGDPVAIDFSTTGEDDARLEQLASDFRDAKPDSQAKIDALGFRERLRMMMRAGVKASNYAASTVIADVGYLYIASSLLQYGLFDPARGGGLWLASDYAGKQWPAGAAIGGLQDAHPGSLAAFFTLLMRNELVDRPASDEIRELLTEDLAPLVPSRSLAGVQKFPKGSLNSLMSRAGISPGAMHDCAVVDRRPDATKDNVVQYIAIGFGSRKSSEWPSLIQELDRCIQLNNSRTTPEISQEVETDESESEPEVEDELGIIGTDDRMPVRDTLAVPFRWVCRIWIQYRIKFESGRVENRGLAPLGTGVLVTRRHVLTAAHNLHDIIDGKEQFASNVEVAPGANENDRPFGTIEAKSWKIASKWKPGSKFSQWDYALITLKDDVGKKTIKGWNDNGPLCYWGSTSGGAGTSVGAVPPALLGGLIGTRVVTAGYPGSTKGQMICAAGAFSAGVAGRGLNSASLVETWIKTNGVFYITADASKGQSGSPVWILNGGKRYMIGILAAIGERENVVVNLMSTALSEIKGWLRDS